MDLSIERPSGRGGERRTPRDRSFAASVWLTVLAAVIPGSGFWVAGRRRLGAVIVAIFVTGVAAASLLAWFDWRIYLHQGLKPTRLLEFTIGLIVVALAWMAVIMFSHLDLRPRHASTVQRAIGISVAIVLCLIVAAPFAVGARYAYTTRDFIKSVFKENPISKTTPKNSSDSNPWGGQTRVNILLLGGDGGVDRQGVRTDSMIVASVDTSTGDTTLFSLPRNLENAPFPPGSKLARLYPNGFNGPGDEGNWLLNAIYRMVPELHPGILGPTDNEGADALKMSISTILGIPIDYYVLINLQGFTQLVDALGGITVNINQPVPIGGNLDTGQPPSGYISPGPHKHLDGYHALWFARGRWNTDDYHRMQNQRCVIDAVINQVNPENILLRYQQIAAAGKKIARTDIPQRLLSPLVDLGLKVKDARIRSVVFQPSAHFNPVTPNFSYMRSIVQKALNPTPAGTHRPKVIQRPQSACAYHPVAGSGG
jgi:polyisoprenyl-teichoic acid--peptidoglycan teichoic acid transferase